jgi:hypothetical protein
MDTKLSTKTKEVKNRSFLCMIFLLKNKTLKCSLAMRQTIRCFQQSHKSALSSCIGHQDPHFTRRLSQTTFNKTSNNNLHKTLRLFIQPFCRKSVEITHFIYITHLETRSRLRRRNPKIYRFRLYYINNCVNVNKNLVELINFYETIKRLPFCVKIASFCA